MGVVLKSLKRYLVVHNLKKRLQARGSPIKSRHRSVLGTKQNHHAAQAVISGISLMRGIVISLGRPNSDQAIHPEAQQDHLLEPPGATWAPVHTMVHARLTPDAAEELQARGAHGATTPIIPTAMMATTRTTITTIPITTTTIMAITKNGTNIMAGSTQHGKTTSTTTMSGTKANHHRCHHHGMEECGMDLHGQMWTAGHTRHTTTTRARFNTHNIMIEFTTNCEDRPRMRSR